MSSKGMFEVTLHYQEIIESELNSNFYIIFNRSGIFGYNKLLKDFEQMTKELFLKKIEKYQYA